MFCYDFTQTIVVRGENLKPRLSIIIPSYNYGKYLSEAIESILNQDYDDYEVILVDDCSTDNSPQISEYYAKQYPQIHYIRHSVNKGGFEAVATAFKESRGDFIHYFSADDKYLPGFLSKIMAFFDTHPEAGVICTDLAYFQDGTDHLEIKRLLAGQNTPAFFQKEQTIPLFRDTNFWVTGASCIAKRAILEKYGPLVPELENLSDWYLFHTIALSEGVGYIPEALTSMRVHKDSLTSQVKQNKKRRRATFHHLLHELLKDDMLRQRYMEAGLLDFVFRDLKWKLYLNPRYRCYWKKRSI